MLSLGTRAGWFLIALVVTLLVAAPAATAAECPLLTDIGLPEVGGSGAWLGNELLLIDGFGGKLFRYDRDGNPKRNIEVEGIPGLAPYSQPRAIQAQPDGLLLQVNNGVVGSLSRGLGVRHLHDVRDQDAKAPDGKRSLSRMYTSWVYSQDHVFYCADIRGGSGYDGAFAVSPWPSMREVWEVRPGLDADEPEMGYCRLAFPYLAAAPDGTFYVLRGLEDSTFIQRVQVIENGISVTNLGAAEFAGRPSVQGVFADGSEYAQIMKTVERSKMAAGLFADPAGDRLYVLLREPRGPETHWELQAVDVESGVKLGQPATLPSRNPHLVVVPGPDAWAFLEQNSALGFYDFESQGLRFIDSADIRDIPKLSPGKAICGSDS